MAYAACRRTFEKDDFFPEMPRASANGTHCRIVRLSERSMDLMLSNLTCRGHAQEFFFVVGQMTRRNSWKRDTALSEPNPLAHI